MNYFKSKNNRLCALMIDTSFVAKVVRWTSLYSVSGFLCLLSDLVRFRQLALFACFLFCRMILILYFPLFYFCLFLFALWPFCFTLSISELCHHDFLCIQTFVGFWIAKKRMHFQCFDLEIRINILWQLIEIGESFSVEFCEFPFSSAKWCDWYLILSHITLDIKACQ